MASKSGGWAPPSGREHPPFKGGQKTSAIGGQHCAGPVNNHGGDESNRSQPNAVTRPPHGVATK